MNPDPQPTLSKKRLSVAILLGMLTFVVTPVVSTVIAIPFALLGAVSEQFNALRIVTDIFGFRELGGFFSAYFLLLGVLAIVGDLVTAFISWLINRSRKLAAVTFGSALVFQAVAVGVVVPLVVQQSREMVDAEMEITRSYQRAAKMGKPSFALLEPYSAAELPNRRPEWGPLHRRLRIVVPVTVSRPGAYRVYVEYSFSRENEYGHPPAQQAMKTLDAGEQELEVEFVADGTFGFWSPSSVGGRTVIRFYYVESAQQVLDAMNAGPSIDKWYIPRALKDSVESMKKSIVNTHADKAEPTFTRYIATQDVRF